MSTFPARAVTAMTLLLLLAACGAGDARSPSREEPQGAGASSPGPDAPPQEDGTVVLQVYDVGGYTPALVLAGRSPLVTLYADGRMIVEGPVPAIWPPPALPNLQLHRVGADGAQELVDRAVAAGLGGTGDLGEPSVTDMATTRFVVRTDGSTLTREAYALGVGPGTAEEGRYGLTDEQVAARERLTALLGELRDPATTLGADRVTGPEPFQPDAVAALATPYTELEPPQPEQPWPGPALPGEPSVESLTCVAVTGPEARAVLEAAASASGATPWVSADGSRWQILLRPLLPHEAGCADLPPG